MFDELGAAPSDACEEADDEYRPFPGGASFPTVGSGSLGS